jgi:hypothetical protein
MSKRCGSWVPNTFNKLKLTDAFTLAVGQPLDEEGLEKAIPESGKNVVVHAPGHPDPGNQRIDPNRWNVHVDQRGIIRKIFRG